MRTTLVIVQTLSFVGLGLLLLTQGQVKLGVAQWCLAAVSALVYG